MADTPTDDLFSGRRPTSHERTSGRPWDFSYQDGPAPWDIGKPQPAIARLVSEGKFAGPVLDAGCGTGENSLLFASLGLAVLGVDVAETAVAMARQKALDRGVSAEFATADALHLDRLGRSFKTVLDSALFHTFNAEERQAYVASLASVTDHDGTLYLLAFSVEGPEVGPHPISRADLEAPFNVGSGWNIVAIGRDHVHTRIHDRPVSAWFATIKRI
jgi:SAM-dependent methyltransferase